MKRGAANLTLVLLFLLATACNQREQCERGDGQLCMDIAGRHLAGKYVNVRPIGTGVQLVLRDPNDHPLELDADIVHLWSRACDHGVALGCAYAAAADAEGNGVPKDPGRALSLARRACQGGGVKQACVE